MNHSISLEQAKAMTARYRQQKENILDPQFRGKDLLLLSETFDAEPFRTLLSQAGCQKLRIYFGMKEDLKVRLIAVGVDGTETEMLSGQSILEEGQDCPPLCPPPPPPDTLND